MHQQPPMYYQMAPAAMVYQPPHMQMQQPTFQQQPIMATQMGGMNAMPMMNTTMPHQQPSQLVSHQPQPTHQSSSTTSSQTSPETSPLQQPQQPSSSGGKPSPPSGNNNEGDGGNLAHCA